MQQRSDVNRARVLNATARLIAEHGIDGMTMRQVQVASGLSTGTINYHFGNKRGLVLAAINYAAQQLRAEEMSDARRLVSLASTTDRLWVEVAAYASRDAALRDHTFNALAASKAVA